MSSNPTQVSDFPRFHHGWLKKQEALLQELDSLLSSTEGFDRNQECTRIIPRVLSEYHEFYQQKSKIANEDIFLLISPPWLSSFERSLLWISGFRPSVLFSILAKSISMEDELSSDQKQRILVMRDQTRRKEKEITQAMARVQETVAEQPVYSKARKFCKLVDGERTDFEDAIEGLKGSILAVVKEADALRGSTAMEIMKVLDPVQGVKFMAVTLRFVLSVRKRGAQKDAERESGPSGSGFRSQGL